MWARSAIVRLIMKITVLVFLLGKEMQRCKPCWQDFCGLVLILLAVPHVSAEDPEGSGIEQKPRDEDQKIEVSVHGLDIVFPVGHVVATGRGGVGHRLRPLSITSQSHLDWLRYPNNLKETKEMNWTTSQQRNSKKKKKTTKIQKPWLKLLFSVQYMEIPCYDSKSATIFIGVTSYLLFSVSVTFIIPFFFFFSVPICTERLPAICRSCLQLQTDNSYLQKKKELKSTSAVFLIFRTIKRSRMIHACGNGFFLKCLFYFPV